MSRSNAGPRRLPGLAVNHCALPVSAYLPFMGKVGHLEVDRFWSETVAPDVPSDLRIAVNRCQGPRVLNRKRRKKESLSG